MKRVLLYSSFLVVFLLYLACTPNANTYYNRQMQPIVTKYNVLFNGEEAYAKGLNELREKYQDNFSEILPVEPIGMTGKVQLPFRNTLWFLKEYNATIKLTTLICYSVKPVITMSVSFLP